MSLRDQLQAIYDESGKLTPAVVLERARRDGHPLHDRFEWDDTVAGEAFRRQQAHDLIQSVRVVYRTATDEERSVRAFQAVRSEEGHVYHPAAVVAADPFLSKLVLADMEREWRTLKARYDQFAEFWQLVRKDAAA